MTWFLVMMLSNSDALILNFETQQACIQYKITNEKELRQQYTPIKISCEQGFIKNGEVFLKNTPDKWI